MGRSCPRRMVDDRITDGTRIAQLLASELDGREGAFAPVSVTDARPDVAPTADGARAYAVVRGYREEAIASGEDGESIATVFVHPERVRIEFAARPERALEAAGEVNLRGRPKAAEPPRTLVFVEDGAAVKRATDVFAAILADE